MADVSTYPEMTVREAAARLYGFRDDDSSFQTTIATLLAGYALEDGVASGNYLVEGGGVVWEQDYDYTVAAATYVIQGAQYSSPETPVTLDPADATNDRIDIIAVDTSGLVVAITGTPAANPQLPDVDPDTQLMLTFVYVAALSTTPGVTTTVMYRENAGSPTEWTYTDNTANLSPSDTAQPFAGSADIAGTSCAAGNQFVLTAGAPLDLSQQNYLNFRLRPNGTWPATKSLKLIWRNSGTQIGNVVTVQPGTFGFTGVIDSDTPGYQTIAIPISLFGVTVPVDELRVRVQGSGAALSFYIDNVELQAGVVPPVASDVMSYAGDWSAATAYVPQQVVRNDGYLFVCVASNVNSEPVSDDSNTSWKVIGLSTAPVLSVNGATGAVSLNGGYIGVKGADIASASTTDLATATGDWVDITGTTTITAFGTVTAGVERLLRFTGALTLTHNATSLIIPGGANITTANGDWARLRSLGSGNWVCVAYAKASGRAVVEPSASVELKGLTFTSDTSSQADSDPGNGVFRWNNATQGSATQLFMDNQTADGVSTSTFWAALGPSGFIYLQQADDATKWQLWKWTATPTNGTGYYKFAVSLMGNGGSIGNAKTVYCQFFGLSATAGADLQATGLVTDAVGFRTIPQNSQSAAYTTVAADSGKHILHPSTDANARTFTIDSNANVAYPVGTAITFVNETSQVVTIAITSDTMTLAGTTTTGSRSLAQNGIATALKVTSTKWIISGTGLS